MASAPSDRQLGYLKGLGYPGPRPHTAWEASQLLDQIKSGTPPCTASQWLISRWENKSKQRLMHAKDYLSGVLEMERQYRSAVGETLISGFRLKVQAGEHTPENEIYDKAFLPLHVATRYPELLAIEGIHDEQLKRVPGHGKFITGPGQIVERVKGEPAPGKSQSGCIVFVIAASGLTFSALLSATQLWAR